MKTEEVKTAEAKNANNAANDVNNGSEEEKGDLKLLLADKDVIPVGMYWRNSFSCQILFCYGWSYGSP